MSITGITDSHYSQNPGVDTHLLTELSPHATFTGTRLSGPTLSQSQPQPDRVTYCLVSAHTDNQGTDRWSRAVENKALPGVSYAGLWPQSVEQLRLITSNTPFPLVTQRD